MARKNIKRLPEIPCGDLNTLKFMLKALYGRERDDLAKRLIDRFGDARGAFIATHEELMSVRGITDRVATFFNIIYPFKRRAAMDALPDDLTRGNALDEFASAMLASEQYATDVALYLDGDGALICAERLPKTERIRAAVAGVCRHDAQKFAWISYIPDGVARPPSYIAEREQTAVRLKGLLDILGVEPVAFTELLGGKFTRFARSVCTQRADRRDGADIGRVADA